MIELNERLKRIRVYECCGIKCWSTSGAAMAIGMSRNTLSNWVAQTLNGALNLPIVNKDFIQQSKNKRNARIPIEEFLRWYSYEQN